MQIVLQLNNNMIRMMIMSYDKDVYVKCVVVNGDVFDHLVSRKRSLKLSRKVASKKKFIFLFKLVQSERPSFQKYRHSSFVYRKSHLSLPRYEHVPL